MYEEKDRKYAFYPVSEKEAVVINNANDFELALVLKKKQENRSIVIKMIDRIVNEKDAIFRTPENKSICLVGHSQLDQWNIEAIGGYKVRNCGVSGIDSFEYYDKILEPQKLNCESDVFLVMHGTNDIVWDYTMDEILESVKKTIDYIREHNESAPILFLSCLHVNGRLDRSNSRIDEMNRILKGGLTGVFWIDTSFLDDKYGDLDATNTTDGLHISEHGYNMLKEKIEEAIKELKL